MRPRHRVLAGLALALCACGGRSSPTAASAAGTPPIQGRYLLSVRPGPLCTQFPAASLDVEVQARAAPGRVELDGAAASGTFEPQPGAPASSLAGRLEVFASEVPVSRSVADTARVSFYVFAQASGSLTQTAGGRAEVRNGELAGSLTLYRTLDGVNHTDRCSAAGHAWSLVAR